MSGAVISVRFSRDNSWDRTVEWNMGPLCTRGCPLNDSIVSGICRCSLGMAWYFSSQLQFCDGLGQFIAGPGPLCPHMVASRCRIPSCGCHSLSQSAGVCFVLERLFCYTFEASGIYL